MGWGGDAYRLGSRTKLSTPLGLINAKPRIGTQWGANVRL
jgi:hypothetical protein